MVFCALDGTVLAVNQAACDLCARPEADIVGRAAVDFIHPDDRADSTAALVSLGSGEVRSVRSDRRFLRPDGTSAWGDTSTELVSGPDGTPRYLQSLIVDITERREADLAQERLAALVHSSPDAIVSYELDGVITSWNPGAERLYGYTAEEAIGKNSRFLWRPGDADEMAEGLSSIGSGTIVEGLEATRVCKDGSLVQVSILAAPLRDAFGEITGVATVTRDLTERTHAESRFRGLLAAGPDAVIGVDGRGKVVLANAAAERLFDHGPGRLIGSSLGDVLSDGSVRGSSTWSQVAHGQPDGSPPMEVEPTGHRRDGSSFPAEVTLSHLDDGDGQLLLVGVRDGTERRQALIVASSADAILSKTLEGIVTSWNKAAEEMYGYTAAEMIGAHVSVIVPPDRREELDECMRLLRAGEPVRHLETRRVHRDGHELHVSVSISPIQSPSGQLVGASAVARDITKTREAQDAMRASEALSSAIVEASLDCIVVMDQNGLIMEFSPTAEDVFGYIRDDVVGRPMADLLIPEAIRSAHHAGLAHYLATGEGPILGRRVEQTGLRRDGTEFPIELAVSRVDLPGPAQFTAYVRDLSEPHRLAAERNDLEHRLQQSQRLESLGQLAGGIAHDFNNLLAVIMNYASFVAERTRGDDVARADVAEIQAAAERAAGLTKQLLIIGRREPVQFQTVDLSSIIDGMENLLTRSIGEHIELRVAHEGTRAAIHADPGQIEQVLLNLVVNARDAMPHGGTLNIETRRIELDEDASLLYPGTAPGRFVELSVSDTGTGMTPEVAARIFEPFFTTKAQGDGTGLGLATAYGIVAAAGGTMSVYSEVEIGTVFRLLFPEVSDAVSYGEVPEAPPSPEGRNETILLVEDEPALMRSTARMLRRNGYTVIEAPDAGTALHAARAEHVDLLLTDVVMPEVSGRVVADRVRTVQPAVNVLFMSGFSQDILDPGGRDAPSDDLMRKPFTEFTLLNRLREALDHDDEPRR